MFSFGEKSIKKVRYVVKKLKRVLFKKDVFSFLLFFLIASTLWFVNSLDKDKIAVLKVPINYTGVPQNVQITNKLPEEVKLTIRDKATNFLSYQKRQKIPLYLNMKQVYGYKGSVVITSDQILNKVSHLISRTSVVLAIEPDSIVANYQKLSSKKLSICVDENITLAKQYIYSDSMVVYPNEVEVYGAKEIIDTMQCVWTMPITMYNLVDSITADVELKPVSGVKFDVSTVEMSLFVEMFTERKQQQQVKKINVPEGINVRLFPNSVTVVYNVGLSNYKKVSENDIQVVFDYEEAIGNDVRKSQLRVINTSPYTHNLRLIPDEVEYLLEEK